MQVGGVSAGFGTSRLWHDPNYEVTRDYRPIPVHKGLGMDEALPKEEHVLPPERREDPFTVQEQAYDVAHQQAVRGEEGLKLLRGTNNNGAFDAAVAAARKAETDVATARSAADVTRTTVQPMAQDPATSMPTGNVAPQQVTPMAAGQVVQPSGASATAAQKDAASQARDAHDASSVVDAVALAGGTAALVGAAAQVASAVPAAASAAVSAGAALGTGVATAAGASYQALRKDPQEDPGSTGGVG